MRILQTQYQFLNSSDKDFSTPLILALKNRKQQIVAELVEHPKTCLRACSAKYGTALHLAFQNEDTGVSLKIL